MDVTGGLPFAGTRVSSLALGASLTNDIERNREKYFAKCEKNGYKFILFAFMFYYSISMNYISWNWYKNYQAIIDPDLDYFAILSS